MLELHERKGLISLRRYKRRLIKMAAYRLVYGLDFMYKFGFKWND